MFLSPDVQQKVLNQRANTLQGSGSIVRGILPGVGSRMGQTAFSKTINPESGSTVTAQVPAGAPLLPFSIPNGMSIEENVSVEIDFTALGNTLTKVPVILFDEAKFYQNYFGVTTPYPAGTVYIGSSANNLYAPWVSGLCAKVYVMYGVQIDVVKSGTAAATEALQYSEKLEIHRLDTRKQTRHELEFGVYNDPANFDRTIRMIPLVDDKARIDRQTAWKMNVYHGIKVKLTFWVASYARD